MLQALSQFLELCARAAGQADSVYIPKLRIAAYVLSNVMTCDFPVAFCSHPRACRAAHAHMPVSLASVYIGINRKRGTSSLTKALLPIWTHPESLVLRVPGNCRCP